MEEILYNVIIDYIDDDEFIKTFSKINKILQLKKRRRQINRYRSAKILYKKQENIKFNLGLCYTSLRRLVYVRNSKELTDQFKTFIDVLFRHSIFETKTAPKIRFKRRYLTPSILFGFTRGEHVNLNDVLIHQEFNSSEIQESEYLCPIYNMTRICVYRMKKFCPQARALIY